MKADGFTLVELIVALSISTILLLVCCRLYQSQCMALKALEQRIESAANLRIAMDYVCDRVKETKTLALNVDKVRVDAGSIYLKNNILRSVDDAQQIAYGISSFEVIKLEEGLYRVRISANGTELDSCVCNRGTTNQ